MALTFNGKTIKCGNEHTLLEEMPPDLAIRQFFSWSQRGLVEVFGGQAGRAMRVQCWIHDASFSSLTALDSYMKTLDMMSGDFGKLSITSTLATGGTIIRENVRFMGFHRTAFNGREVAEPIPAIGVHGSNYGAWHIQGEMHFYQLRLR